MGAKSKRKKRRPSPAASALETLRSQMKDSGLLEGREVHIASAGEEKLSATLLQFIEPYRWLARDYETMKRLVTLAVVAWNGAIFGASGGPSFVDPIIESALPNDEAMRRDFRQTINDMVERKQRYFGNNQRIIVSYTLTERPHDYHLSVASLAAPGDLAAETD
jgi:hypothetical protein